MFSHLHSERCCLEIEHEKCKDNVLYNIKVIISDYFAKISDVRIKGIMDARRQCIGLFVDI